ncbi:MAG: LptF/LptG family permease [Cyclobacteriaceae bacterium]|nr:LptF/LptG family permease [Cyclobacteriaceae bacterium]MCB0500052.1 LptF/LptG family permease [Cyclobacteriaceae bacterium]MCB9239346.1 LptF/LptG family permease [Flammeovirgaceae bacterium]MCO5271341.1 LptF/LptG family permease [Cyclobacteriaceae bacterium]MCW5903664.1 LptF/LptG family permease [Cyclobacteriaceae bacterium]
MKKIDKLIISSFLGPFILTFLVVVFILLTQHMLKYFDDIIGKDLGWDVLGTLLFYFAIFMTPVALPLAVLLSSLIAFGNLGEHFELTAVKSLGISLVRSLFPIFVFVVLLTGAAFYANNNLVPKAALEAYSLLYDIKQKKPALDLREGAFYNAIPDISIKVNKKLPDGQTLKGIIIYDHRNRIGNREVTIADSGRMYTILNDQYLKLELFNGYNYSEGTSQGKDGMGRANAGRTLSKTKFDKSQIVFDLSSFGLNRTDKKWFQGNRIMRNMSELEQDMDSIGKNMMNQKLGLFLTTRDHLFNYHSKLDTLPLPKALAQYKAKRDSAAGAEAKPPKPSLVPAKKETLGLTRKGRPSAVANDTATAISFAKTDSLLTSPATKEEVTSALNYARMVKGQIVNYNNQINTYGNDYRIYQIQWHKILANSLACIAMFLIGAPLGAIIKRGGLGVPVLGSIIFFILYYILSMMGDKWARQDAISVPVGIWMADTVLLVIGLLFLRQARVDARLFEADFYRVAWDKLKTWAQGKKQLSKPVA